ncbi:MAG: hypothetical protein JWQ27_2144 [Ferruginibacter sp.]|nr:hypothetical protein [Ferruginibacter sp.]
MKQYLLLAALLCNAALLSAQELTRFEKNGKCGFKDAAGNVIIKPIYNYASYSFTSLGGVSNKAGWAVIDNQGNLLTGFTYAGVGNAKGYGLVPVYTEKGFMGVDRYHGLVNRSGKEIAAPHYNSVEILSNDLALVEEYGKYGIMNSSGQLVLPVEFEKDALKIFTNIQPNGAYFKNGRWKAFSYDGGSLRLWKYDDIALAGEFIWPVRYQNKWGFTDTLGREIVSPKYDSVGIYGGGVTWVAIAGKKGVIDSRGNVLVPVKYDRISSHGTENYQVCIAGKCGLTNATGRELVPLKYSLIAAFTEGLAAVQGAGKWGFVDEAGREVIPLQFDGVLSFSDGAAAVRVNNKIGFIDKKGNLMIAAQFDKVVEPFYKGKAIVSRDGKEIYIDKSGKEIR